MKIYNQEINDGLESKLQDNSIILNSVAKNSDSDRTSERLEKCIAGAGIGKNFDLYFIDSILVSANWNANDHFWLPQELYIARETPVYKKFNLEHNEKEIIGHIIDSKVLDANGQEVNEDNQNDVLDILVSSVIYSEWEDEEYDAKIKTILAEIEDNQWFVSMEALFSEFDYAIKAEDSSIKIVSRDDTTAFLTKHLRHFGGDGKFNDKKVGMVPRNFTFCGKGLVRDPANKRGLIIQTTKEQNFVQELIAEGHNIMAEAQKTNRESELEASLAEMTAKVNKLTEAKAEVVAKEISSLKAENEDLQAKIETLTALASELKEEKETLEASYTEKLEASKEEIKAVTAKVSELEAEKVVATRTSKLIAVNVEADKAAELCKVWAESTEEQFDSIVELYSQQKTEKVEAKEDEVKETASAESVDLEEDLEAEQNVNLAKAGVEDRSEKMEALIKEVASYMGSNKKKES